MQQEGEGIKPAFKLKVTFMLLVISEFTFRIPWYRAVVLRHTNKLGNSTASDTFPKKEMKLKSLKNYLEPHTMLSTL
jgi:hypothetical protein